MDTATLEIIEAFLRDMETASLDGFAPEQQDTIRRGVHLLRSVADEIALNEE